MADYKVGRERVLNFIVPLSLLVIVMKKTRGKAGAGEAHRPVKEVYLFFSDSILRWAFITVPSFN